MSLDVLQPGPLCAGAIEALPLKLSQGQATGTAIEDLPVKLSQGQATGKHDQPGAIEDLPLKLSQGQATGNTTNGPVALREGVRAKPSSQHQGLGRRRGKAFKSTSRLRIGRIALEEPPAVGEASATPWPKCRGWKLSLGHAVPGRKPCNLQAAPSPGSAKPCQEGSPAEVS